ncbi:heavy metal-associated isoprenylated plant protein 3-like [Helianthus annuus]|uniref:heavy metal-associated isoprenylated plant protein 3-like n=1 Tax=Helianthus annuus TaxID=4232 RepID=UPI001652CA60|nr:heavy metal-associated isoprenylated plant protein 3-like [Helianthus annuus]
MTQSNDNEKQINGGQKNDSVTMLLKFNMHCDRCARKVVKFVSSLQGVDSVTRRENDWKKIMVVGKVDPVKLREIVEVKYNKNVELISPATKKHLDFVKDEINHKQFPVTTVVLKVSLNCGGCRGCIKKIQKLIEEAKGFVEMSIDKSNNLVMVKGAMDMNVLMMTLKKKLKRQIEIVQAKGNGGKKGKGDDANGEGNESGGQGATFVQGNGGGGKEETCSDGDGEGTKSGGRGARVVQGNGNDGKKGQGDDRAQEGTKSGGRGARVVQGNGGDGNKGKGDDRGGEGKESGGRGPIVVQGKGGSGKKGKGAGVSEGPSLVGYNYRMEIYAGQGQYTYPQYINRPENTFNYMNATQMFNDENPNACVVM